MRRKKIALVVMASGFGKRYGTNKLLEFFCGKKLYQYVLELVADSEASPIIVVTRFQEIKEYILNHYPEIQVVWNTHPESGISESLRLGLNAAGEVDGCCFMVCDQPLFKKESLSNLLQKFQENSYSIIACNDGIRRGNPVIFPYQFLGELMELTGDQGGRQVILRHKEKLLEIAVYPEELMDIDCVADKYEMERRLENNKIHEVIKVRLLEERIQKEGKALSESVLKVDSFINHQVDPEFMEMLGKDFAEHFKDFGITKVFTIESSGIAPAMMVAKYLHVPMVILKKQTSKILNGNVYQTRITSFTKGTSYELTLFSDYISPDDRILLIDDFLANGEAATGASRLVEQSGAKLAGIGILIEKSFQNGRKRLEDAGYYVYSQVRVSRLDAGVIEFLPEDEPTVAAQSE